MIDRETGKVFGRPEGIMAFVDKRNATFPAS